MDVWVKALIGIGSNQGDRLSFCQEAIRRMEAHPAVRLQRLSSLYETKPMDYTDQPWFYNAVVAIETSVSPIALLSFCQTIEHALGKAVPFPKGPRTIDLDILFYDDVVQLQGEPLLPHPAIASRAFVLVPLYDVAPFFVHPVLKETIHALLQPLLPTTTVKKQYGEEWLHIVPSGNP